MKFYDRKKELEILARAKVQSEGSACFTVMVGRRRIGKTSLLLESVKGTKYLYIFVTRKSETLLCEQYLSVVKEVLGVEVYGEIREFSSLFELLMKESQKKNFTLIIDEFQEFMYINPAIIGEIQRIWDLYHAQSKMNLIVCGSIYSMMKNIFENQKEPLYGRATSKIMLKPFTVSVVKEILADFYPAYTKEDLLCLYLLTGGVAKYIVLFMQAKAYTRQKMVRYALSQGSPLLTEGKDVLISEFGKDYAVYFSILSLIAGGKNSQKEIDSVIGKNTGSYLVNLEEEYSLVQKLRPLFSKPGSRMARYCINDNFLRFGFRFIFPNDALLEMGKNDALVQYVQDNYEQYSGIILEKYFLEKISEEENITDIGGYWDRKGENEIDLIALNRWNKTALVGEVKRKRSKININDLQKKTGALENELRGYDVELRGFSMDDM